MKRQQYREARRMVRDNGYQSLRWMPRDVAKEMGALRTEQEHGDYLAERASVIAWCRSEGISYNVRQTGRNPIDINGNTRN